MLVLVLVVGPINFVVPKGNLTYPQNLYGEGGAVADDGVDSNPKSNPIHNHHLPYYEYIYIYVCIACMVMEERWLYIHTYIHIHIYNIHTYYLYGDGGAVADDGGDPNPNPNPIYNPHPHPHLSYYEYICTYILPVW